MDNCKWMGGGTRLELITTLILQAGEWAPFHSISGSGTVLNDPE